VLTNCEALARIVESLEVAVGVISTAALSTNRVVHRSRVALGISFVSKVRCPVHHTCLRLLAPRFQLINVSSSLAFFDLAIVLSHSAVFKLALSETELEKVRKTRQLLLLIKLPCKDLYFHSRKWKPQHDISST